MSLSAGVSHFIENIIVPMKNKISKFNWEKLKDFIRRKLPGYSREKDIQPLLEEFQKFLFIKIVDGDLDAAIYSPSYLIDEVWHLFLLLPKDYNNFCTEMLGEGKILDHNPFGGDNSIRYKNSRRRYKQLFGSEPPLPYWEEESSTDEKQMYSSPTALGKRARSSSVFSSSSSSSSSSSPTFTTPSMSKVTTQPLISSVTPLDFLTIFVNCENGFKMPFKVIPQTEVSRILRSLSERICLKDKILLYDGNRALSEDTIQSLKCKDGDTFDLLINGSGC